MSHTDKPGQDASATVPSPDDSFDEALKHHRAGRVDEAERLYKKVLAAKADNAAALRLLGVIEHQRGHHEQALRQIDAALEIDPNFAQAWNSRGNALLKLGRLDDALASYDHAITVSPDYASAHYNRGGALHEMKRLEDALASYDSAIACRSSYAQAFNTRGNVLKEMARLDDALASYDRAIALDPEFSDAFKNRGSALQKLWRLDEAVASYDQAIRLKPEFAEAFNNRGSALHELRRLDEALASYDHALALKPEFASAFLNRSMTRLFGGNFREGWPDYEWRWKANGIPRAHVTVDAPLWQGEDLAGRRIVIYAEQGLGDVIQFARYLPLLAEHGVTVTFLAPAKLVRLLSTLSSRVEVVSAIDPGRDFDFHCALMDVPMRFGTDSSTVPDGVPYIHAEKELVARWEKRLGKGGIKIGIAWQGKPGQTIDHGRSIALAQFVPLSEVPGVRLISLQKSHGTDQLAGLPPNAKVETLGDEFDGGPDAFIDTAAVMANLDLVISSDTSIAHLAGALGRPTWVALKHVPDWRWLMDRGDCPWYPTMRLFRQKAAGDWKSVFSAIEKSLKADPYALARQVGIGS